MIHFQTLGLPQQLMYSLDQMKFIRPTPIQSQAIPLALQGKDILGSAQTGTGKTGAFGIPLITRLISHKHGSALVLTPTRELATQVMQMLKQMLGKNSSIKTALIIGGEPILKQIQQLKVKPRLIIGTPGRINDLLARGSLVLGEAGFLVLDETDRMLDMGFGVQLEKIFKHLPQQRQTLMFSATLPAGIVKLSAKYLKDPVRVSIGSSIQPATKIKQETIRTSDAAKYDELVTQLQQRTGSVLVFVKTKHGAEKLALRLRRENHSVDALHGDLRQNKRERVINAFRDQKRPPRILVATDIAARGLDIPHIEHVVNYDLPQCPEDYIHRIGRTGRAGAEGNAVSLITSQDAAKWKAIHRVINPGEKITGDTSDFNRSNRRARPAVKKAQKPIGKKPSSARRHGKKRSS